MTSRHRVSQTPLFKEKIACVLAEVFRKKLKTQVSPSFFACKIGDFEMNCLVCLQKSLFTFFLVVHIFWRFFQYATKIN
jgi:hypothetical protein